MTKISISRFAKLSRSPQKEGVVLLVAACVACIFILTGCLSRPALKTATFSFDTPIEVAATETTAPVLGIKKISVAAPFASRPLVYRTGQYAYERDPYAEFLDSPEKELMAPIQAGLGHQGDFRSVVSAGDALEPNIIVEINISQLYGDFRERDNARAILRADFMFFQATNGIASDVTFQKEYSQEIPLKEPTAAALMAGWNQALDGIIGEVLTDYRNRRN